MSVKELAEEVFPRLIKLKCPKKKKAVVNSINAMFNFTGGIEEAKVEQVINELARQKKIKINGDSIEYLGTM